MYARYVHTCAIDTCCGNDQPYNSVICLRLSVVMEMIINVFAWCCEWGIH